MKERLKNWLSTGIGISVIIISLIMFTMSKIDGIALGSLLTLGYTFVCAKDTLITGITGGIVKGK